MRKLLIIISVLILLHACKKDDCPNICISSIEDDIVLDIHYNKLFGCGNEPNGGFIKYYFNEEEFRNDNTCYHDPIPFELGFEGIIVAQGVKVPYLSENENIKKAYNLSVELLKDSCSKTIDFHFVLANVDTFERADNNRNVIVLLNGVDSTYTVNFSHEIIPYKE